MTIETTVIIFIASTLNIELDFGVLITHMNTELLTYKDLNSLSLDLHFSGSSINGLTELYDKLLMKLIG